MVTIGKEKCFTFSKEKPLLLDWPYSNILVFIAINEIFPQMILTIFFSWQGNH